MQFPSIYNIPPHSFMGRSATHFSNASRKGDLYNFAWEDSSPRPHGRARVHMEACVWVVGRATLRRRCGHTQPHPAAETRQGGVGGEA